MIFHKPDRVSGWDMGVNKSHDKKAGHMAMLARSHDLELTCSRIVSSCPHS